MPGRGHTKQKKLGQCFLVDDGAVRRIVAGSGVAAADRVLEVGPGRGILTRALLHAGGIVHAVELDRELYDHLKKELGANPNLTLEKGNALRFDFGSFPAPYKIISNLPYSVSVALIKTFIENRRYISEMTLMVQAEVGERLTATAGDGHYGSLSVFVNYHCRTSLLFRVPPESFRPAPKVESAVVRLAPRLKPAVDVPDEDGYFRFVQTAFVHRRKTIRNNLKAVWGHVDKLDEAFTVTAIAPSSRPEDVSMEGFAALYREWVKDSK
ncbi:MAG: ribosomal RNA small subunit methyltransferase A [Nitrospinae bacterium]|nr:ribosomal RNA small subunit methyltransferase A [Nitrospinota bacterium]